MDSFKCFNVTFYNFVVDCMTDKLLDYYQILIMLTRLLFVFCTDDGKTDKFELFIKTCKKFNNVKPIDNPIMSAIFIYRMAELNTTPINEIMLTFRNIFKMNRLEPFDRYCLRMNMEGVLNDSIRSILSNNEINITSIVSTESYHTLSVTNDISMLHKFIKDCNMRVCPHVYNSKLPLNITIDKKGVVSMKNADLSTQGELMKITQYLDYIFDNPGNKIFIRTMKDVQPIITRKTLADIVCNYKRNIIKVFENKFYKFTNHRFQIIDIENLLEYIKSISKKIEYDISPKLNDDIFIESFVVNLNIQLSDNTVLNNNTNLLCFNNGIYDLEKNDFRDGVISDYISFSTGYDFPTKYSENKHILINFISTIFPDEEHKKQFLRCITNILFSTNGKIRLSGDNATIKKITKIVKSTCGDYYKYRFVLDDEKNSINVCPYESKDIFYKEVNSDFMLYILKYYRKNIKK